MKGEDVIVVGNGLGKELNSRRVGNRAWTSEGSGKTKVLYQLGD
jgi:hypothetical protein